MSRRKLATVSDFFGDAWDVFEVRDTPRAFPVLLGYPAERPRVWPAGGGKRVILTPELAAHLETHRRARFEDMRLPIGKQATQRLRRLLGHHRQLDAQAWWDERFRDLCELTLEAFAVKHGVKTGAVEFARLALLGKTNRDNGWWRIDPARSALLSDRSTADVADELGIAAGSVRRLRWMLRHE